MIIQSEVVVGEISVCIVCMFEHANGEYPGDPADRDPSEPDAWASLPFGYSPAMGGEHRDGCDADGEGCDCDSLGFSHYSCEGCGSGLGGDRYRFTLFRFTRDSAIATARNFLKMAGEATYKRSSRVQFIEIASEYRRYAASYVA